jgi:3-hydroxyisobutyrate dehydrogenase-like beta-hydroxyacid dehydrogenase
VYSRGRFYHGFLGDVFDIIARERRKSTEWWLSDEGLNTAIVNPATPLRPRTFDELIGGQMSATSGSPRSAQFVSSAVRFAASPAELARSVDVVLSCLPDDRAVEDVYLGTGDVIGTAGSYARIIELSTIAPDTARRLNSIAGQLGILVLDVAISGSTPAAESGSLTLFGGGEHADFDAAEAVFQAIARQWFYMGPSGAGVGMKLVVNTLLGLGMQAIAESLALGLALGLPHDLLFETLAKTTVVAPAHVGKLATAKHSDYTAQFPLRLMRKDFSLILSEAARLRLWMPATESAAAINAAEARGGREEDFSVVIRRMQKEAEMDWSGLPAAADEDALLHRSM